MKKSVQLSTLFMMITLLSLIPIISAVEITISKDSYQPQELLQAEITGNFLSLTSNNIFIYKPGKAHPEPVIKGLTKQNNIYYFYTLLPNQPGNFTLRIQDTLYLERGIAKSDPIDKSIKLELKNTSDLSINPGFVVPNKDFSIKVKSLIGNQELTATFELTGESKQLSLIEQKEETISFKLPDLPPQQSKITINNYQIPVFLIKKIKPVERSLEFIPYKLEGTLTTKDYHFNIVLKNSGKKTLENIKLSSDLQTIIQPETIPLLEPNQLALVNLTIIIPELTEDKLSGKLTAETTSNKFYLPISFDITKNETEVQIDDVVEPSPGIAGGGGAGFPGGAGGGALSCSQLGELCDENQFCTGDTVASLEGACCIGECSDEEASSASTYVGIGLFVVLILIVIYVIWQVRKRKKIKSPEDLLKEKGEQYKERMEGKPKPGKEVEGKLDKV